MLDSDERDEKPNPDNPSDPLIYSGVRCHKDDQGHWVCNQMWLPKSFVDSLMSSAAPSNEAPLPPNLPSPSPESAPPNPPQP